MKSVNSLISALLLVSLVPVLALAHSGNGACADCHVMHFSQDGSTSTPADQLLKVTCIGCHARAGVGNDTDGRAVSGIRAPQVNDPANPLAGGYFDSASADGLQHNVSDLSLPLDGAFLTVIPGSGDTYNALSQVGCTKCHDLTLGHSAADAAKDGDVVSGTGSYRMLNGNGMGVYVAGTGDANYEVGIAASNTVYDAASMNLFCATCHGNFHGNANTSANNDGSAPWIRHPTDVNAGIYGELYQGGIKAIPLGDAGATGTNQIMCISCHRPHGSAVNDLLRFSYSGIDNFAGDTNKSLGCETCHGVK